MIELTPGQEIELTGTDGEPLGQLRMGVGWDKDPTSGFIGTGKAEIDLDATALQFLGDGRLFDVAFYNNLATRDGSVVHRGDNQSGSGLGDDEQVDVDLARVHPPVSTIVLLVSSYQGHSLEWVAGAYCRIVDEHDVEIARLTLTLGVPQTALVMAKLFRDGSGWKLRAIGEGAAVTVPTKSIEVLAPYL